MKYGYARVIDGEDTLAAQIDMLRAAGAEQIFEDRGVSGSTVLKPAYGALLRQVRRGDELMVWRLDRLSKSYAALIQELRMIDALGLGFQSLADEIDTADLSGSSFFGFVAALAKFERDVSAERAHVDRQAAQGAGAQRGRPPLVNDDQWSMAVNLMAGPDRLGPGAVAKLLGISRQAVHKRLKASKMRQEGDVSP